MLVKVLQNLPPATVIDNDGPFFELDLSVKNPHLPKKASADDWETFIGRYLKDHGAKVAYGGYAEKRNLYRRSELFHEGETAERDVHIGLDFWTDAGTAVLAPIDVTPA